MLYKYNYLLIHLCETRELFIEVISFIINYFIEK